MFDIISSWIVAHGGGILDIALGAIALQIVIPLRKLVDTQVETNKTQNTLLAELVSTQSNHEGRIVALETVTKPLGFQPRPVV